MDPWWFFTLREINEYLSVAMKKSVGWDCNTIGQLAEAYSISEHSGKSSAFNLPTYLMVSLTIGVISIEWEFKSHS